MPDHVSTPEPSTKTLVYKKDDNFSVVLAAGNTGEIIQQFIAP